MINGLDMLMIIGQVLALLGLGWCLVADNE